MGLDLVQETSRLLDQAVALDLGQEARWALDQKMVQNLL